VLYCNSYYTCAGYELSLWRISCETDVTSFFVGLKRKSEQLKIIVTYEISDKHIEMYKHILSHICFEQTHCTTYRERTTFGGKNRDSLFILLEILTVGSHNVTF